MAARAALVPLPDTLIPATEGLSPRWTTLCEDAVADLCLSPDGTLLAVASCASVPLGCPRPVQGPFASET